MNKLQILYYFLFLNFFQWNLLLSDQNENSFEMSVASEVEVRSMVIQKGKHKLYCLFPRRWDNTSLSSKNFNASSSMEKGALPTEWYVHGKTYNLKEVNWSGGVKDNRFTLNFDSKIEKDKIVKNIHDGKCTFRKWHSKVSSNSTAMLAKGIILVPENTWVIRTKTNVLNGSSTFDLKVKGFKTPRVGQRDLGELDVSTKSFTEGSYDYFLVGPSRFIQFELNMKDNSMSNAYYNIDIEIEFLGQDECMSNIYSRDIKDIFNDIQIKTKTLNAESLDRNIKTLACLTTTPYVRHVLSTLLLSDDLNWIFDVMITEEIKTEETLNNNESLNSNRYSMLISRMLKRARFYLAYEVIKDSITLLEYVKANKLEILDYDIDLLINGWEFDQNILQMLRFKKVNILRMSTINLIGLIKQYSDISINKSAKAQISKNGYNTFNQIFNNGLIPEVNRQFKLYDEIVEPQFLSSYRFKQSRYVVDRMKQEIKDLEDFSKNILGPLKSLSIPEYSDLQTFRQLLVSFNMSISLYNEYIKSLSRIFGVTDSKLETKKMADNFRYKILKIYIKNVYPLVGQLSQYYLDNFEDELFLSDRGLEPKTIEQTMEYFEKVMDQL